MREFALAALCAAVSLSQIPPPPPAGAPPVPTRPAPEVKPEDRGSFEGVVVHLQTGVPLRGANVTARAAEGGSIEGISTTTDAEGKFVLKDIAPGRYSLSAAKNGFVTQQYGAGAARGAGAMLTLTPAGRLRDLKFRLTPHAVITGRVLDENGEPMVGVAVGVARYQFVRGRRTLATVNQAMTNDLGEYRMFGLAPGRYYCRAMFRYLPRGEADSGYGPVFYPNAADPKGAAQVALTPGATLAGVDFTMRRTAAYRVTGRIAGEGRVSPGTMVLLQPRDAEWELAYNVFPAPVQASGRFELRGVLPGSYLLLAQEMSEGGSFRSGRLPLDVSRNVDGVELQLGAGVEVAGEVVLDGAAEALPFATEGFGAQVLLTPLGPPQIVFGRTSARIADGKFSVRGVGPDSYRVSILGLAPEAYLKAVRAGDSELSDGILDLSGGAAPGTLTLVVSKNGASVEGEVLDAERRPLPAAQVLLAPEEGKRQAAHLFKVASTDQNGHYSMKGIVPGNYKLFALQTLEPGAQFDPDFLQAIEARGKTVKLAEKGAERIELQVIAAPDANH